ncbi:MAG: hybrid sensor histidine kinase/response regulator [Spirochaetaceae bacterium]|nr:MAG: hybrid sensor histidine kinase/response regulator [Spirochaetaceae bacterium]
MSDRNETFVLIVDDNTNNLGVLYRYLDDEGFTVLVSQDGERAVRLAREQQPDLILLDIMLPGMNGFETCRALKSDERTAGIPVIFISALTDVQDKVRGFRAGGVDYITKPFNQEEVLARIVAHVTIKRQREQLDELNATKDRLFSIIGHDLRGPFMGLLGALELLRDCSDDLDSETAQELIENLYGSAEKTYHLLENLLEWARSQRRTTTIAPRAIDVARIVSDAVQVFSAAARQKGVSVRVDIPDGTTCFADRDMINTVVRNLVNNAIKFTGSDGAVTITARSNSETVTIVVADTGVGIAPDDLCRLFDLGRSISRSGTGGERGTGLGLMLARDYVSRNGGTISAESVQGCGSTFRLTLPAGPTTEVEQTADS